MTWFYVFLVIKYDDEQWFQNFRMTKCTFFETSEGNPWLHHSSHPWHLARPLAAAALAYFFKE